MRNKNEIKKRLVYWAAVLGVASLFLFAVPQRLDPYQLNLLGRFLTYGIVAAALDLIWGFGGMLSLGQGLFFGLGAYAMGMYLKLEASGKSLPDFMDYNGLTSLPAFWKPFHSPIFAIAAAILVPMTVAAAIGFLIFRSRVQGVYFSIITQALTLIASILIIGQQPYTAGTNGLTSFTTLFGHSLSEDSTQTGLYWVTVVALALVFVLCHGITKSRFGKLLVAMRDDENRVRFLGYNPVVLKIIVFAISAGLTGLAGALFVPQVGLISPSQLAVSPSVEMVIWVAVGGRGTIIGPIIGAILVSWGKSTFSSDFPDSWQYFMGALFIGSVLVFPKGIVGTLIDSLRWCSARIHSKQMIVGFRPAPTESDSNVEAAELQ